MAGAEHVSKGQGPWLWFLQGFMMGYFGRADFSLKLCLFASEEAEFWERV